MYKGHSISSCRDDNAGDLWNLHIMCVRGTDRRSFDLWSFRTPPRDVADGQPSLAVGQEMRTSCPTQTGPLVNMAELPTQTSRRRKGDSSHWYPLRVFDICKDR